MNAFTGKRTTNLFIFVLVILNLALLGTFWYTRLEPRKKRTAAAKLLERDKAKTLENRGRRSERLVHFLQKELDFTQDQVDKFLRLRHEHFEKTDGLQRGMKDLRKEMMDLLLEEEPDSTQAAKLADAMGEKLAEHEKAVFEHFLQLMAVCDAEQKVKYKRLLREILHQLRPPGGRHPGDGGQPPPTRPPGQEHPGIEPPDRRHREDEMGAANYLERLRRELALTGTQVETIRPILEAAMEKLQRIPNDPAYRGHPERREAANQVLQLRDRKIRDLLTEEQKLRFDQMIKRKPPGEKNASGGSPRARGRLPLDPPI